MPAAEQIAEQRLEMPFDNFQCFREQPPTVDIDPVDDLFERTLGRRKILELIGQRFVTRFELIEFVERFEIHIA